MPASPHVAHYTNDDYLRHLLDQRTARADFLGRFSAISECSDTPSVYSRTQFSPGPSDSGDHVVQGFTTHPAAASPSAAHTARQNANANFDAVGSSMLDLGYDSRTSYAPSDTQDEDDRTEFDAESEADAPSRMSYLGPKMRFHSRAPWEMDETALDEEDEESNAGSSFVFSRSDPLKLHTSSSPRPSQLHSRPSGESSRSQVPPKRSFETIDSRVSARGALYALAQESLSATSLGRISTAPLKETIRSKFSRSRPPPDIHTGPPPSTHMAYPPSPTFEPSLPSGNNSHFPQSFKTPASSEHAHMQHPYANPDLVVSYADDDDDHPPRSPLHSSHLNLNSHSTTHSHSKFAAGSRNDSSATVTGTGFSPVDSITKSLNTLTPDSSVHSFSRKHRASSILSKNTISSPVPVGNNSHLGSAAAEPATPHSLNFNESVTGSPPPNVSHLAGWTERSVAPAFSLISLEEARAQRLRNVASQQSISVSSTSRTSNLSGSAPATDTDFSHSLRDDASPIDSSTRSRGRSMSAGAKARNAIHTIVPKLNRQFSEPATSGSAPHQAASSTNGAAPGKTLKHKKSGFMRLFNGGNKGQHDDEPPPVPILPDSDKYQAPLRTTTPRSAVQRIPVPSLSPSLHEVASSQSVSSASIPDSPSVKKIDLLTSPKRIPPSLSINTLSSNGMNRSSTSIVADGGGDRLGHDLHSWASSQQPQSAPANMHEFPTLRLRPVSTLFSAHFGDHIMATPESRSSEETAGVETPRSSSPNGGMMSPLSPVISLTRTSGEKIITGTTATAAGGGGVVAPESEDPAQATIKSLQRQLASSKVSMQRQIWELEGQVRDLQAELEDVKGKYGDEYCNACGRGKKVITLPPALSAAVSGGGVVNRPRARTGVSSRFG